MKTQGFMAWLGIVWILALGLPTIFATLPHHEDTMPGRKFRAMIQGTSQHISVLLPTGGVLAIGGDYGKGGSNIVQHYEPVAQTWTLYARLPTPLFVHTAATLRDGRVYVAGGYNHDKGFLSEAWIFDPLRKTTIPAPHLLEARDNQRSVALPDGRVLMIGGDNENPGYIKTTEYFDPAAMENTFGPSFPVGQAMDSVTLLQDGTILICGGMSAEPDDERDLDTAFILDPVANTLRSTGRMTTPRKQAAAVLMADGRVLVTGGVENENDLASAEIYDPKTGKFTPAGHMAVARYAHTATLLKSGKVLIAGGLFIGPDTLSTVESSAELYDPEIGTFEALPSMRRARALHSAIRLKNGDVLVMGGYNKNGLEGEYAYPAMTDLFVERRKRFR